MNRINTEQKLRDLKYDDLVWLVKASRKELETRGSYCSNVEDSPDTIKENLSEMFGRAWIHG